LALRHEKKEDIILLLMAGDYMKRILGVVLREDVRGRGTTSSSGE
jgi:hypothetical protein